LYKNVLKSYSQVLVERGFHSLFFPGGTRCRSNHVDHQLKLGLLGTSVSAYIHNLQQGRDNRIYICPATINYNLVLEAESLIREHLKREGGNRYFLDDDEFNQVSTVARFVMNTVSMNSTTVIRYGKPFDPFGNHVEADGESYDLHGRPVDPKTYVQSISTGDFVEDRERDFAYTRFTGEKIAESFLENTVLQPASIVAYAMFEILAARYPKIDVYELLRFATNERIAWTEVAPVVRATVDQLRDLEQRGAVRLTEHARNLEELIDEGVDALTAFHVPAVIEPQGSGLLASRLDVLYFYGNRVRSYDVDVRDAVAEGGRP
jgi:glycerol-3-phosphate O-acyltransferase